MTVLWDRVKALVASAPGGEPTALASPDGKGDGAVLGGVGRPA
jgi:hypothetical protein